MRLPVDVLVLANLHDFPTDRVCSELQDAGARYFRLNAETLKQARLRLVPQEQLLEVECNGTTWVIDGNLKSVWWRQPTFLRNTPYEAMSLQDQLERSQWPAFLRGLTLFDQAKWINHPAQTYRAESKPWQLHRAARLGFSTPLTLITNDPGADVVSTLGSKVAVKSVDTVLLREQGQQYFSHTQIIDWADCATDDLAAAPVMVQEAVTPKIDLRVTVIGENIWTVSVLSEERPIEGDWRLQKKGKLTYPAYDLPLAVARRCIDFVRDMGLIYGAIDLMVRGGDYLFVEINPTGEWGWLDTPERPLAKSIANELIT
ncbi:RimK-like protein [Asticcacaulis sp. W401b]|uniref:RimK-like protein n=1 Tax=Asticcacaulis sp. W401b TaxID=3388666 RepID=UPI003970C5DF